MTRVRPDTNDMSLPVRIVLVNPSHAGNIGAAARAMKTMGLTQLYLVASQDFPSDIAYARAAGATDVLDNAVVVADFSEAIGACGWVVGTSHRQRFLDWPMLTSRAIGSQVITTVEQTSVAIVFGPERSGLNNQQLQQCDCHMVIPSAADYGVLNLASAVQIVAYEIRQAWIDSQTKEKKDLAEVRTKSNEMANAADKAAFYQHLEQTLVRLQYLNPNEPGLLMQRMRRLLTRADADRNELNMLHGLLSAIDKLKLKETSL